MFLWQKPQTRGKEKIIKVRGHVRWTQFSACHTKTVQQQYNKVAVHRLDTHVFSRLPRRPVTHFVAYNPYETAQASKFLSTFLLVWLILLLGDSIRNSFLGYILFFRLVQTKHSKGYGKFSARFRDLPDAFRTLAVSTSPSLPEWAFQ